jgi:hypothetical protein
MKLAKRMEQLWVVLFGPSLKALDREFSYRQAMGQIAMAEAIAYQQSSGKYLQPHLEAFAYARETVALNYPEHAGKDWQDDRQFSV